MAYASIEDVWKRKGTDIPDTDYVTALLDDAAIIIDAYNRNATDEAKVSVAIVPSRYPLSLSLIAGSLSASVWIICFSFSDILFSFLRLFCCYVFIVCGFETFVNTFLWLFDFLLLCHIFYCFSSLYAV